MLEFLLWCGVASVGASLALVVVAWAGRCRCPACAPVRWRLTRPALDGAPIVHRDSEAAVLASAQEAGFPPWPKEYGKGTSYLQSIQSQDRGHRATGGPVRVRDFVGNDGPEMFIPFKRYRK